MHLVKSLVFLYYTAVLLATAQKGNNDRQPSLWEIILGPSPSSRNGGFTNDSKATTSTARAITTAKTEASLPIGDNKDMLTKVVNLSSNGDPAKDEKRPPKAKKRVVIDLSYTLGCTKEGYFPLAKSCFHFLHCQKSSLSSSIGYRGFVFRCPNGFGYVHSNDHDGAKLKGPRCQPLSKEAPKCDQNTNDPPQLLDVPRDII